MKALTFNVILNSFNFPYMFLKTLKSFLGQNEVKQGGSRTDLKSSIRRARVYFSLSIFIDNVYLLPFLSGNQVYYETVMH